MSRNQNQNQRQNLSGVGKRSDIVECCFLHSIFFTSFYTPFFLFYCKQFTYKYIYFFHFFLRWLMNRRKNMKLLCRENIVCTGESHGCDITLCFKWIHRHYHTNKLNIYCIFRISYTQGTFDFFFWSLSKKE